MSNSPSIFSPHEKKIRSEPGLSVFTGELYSLGSADLNLLGSGDNIRLVLLVRLFFHLRHTSTHIVQHNTAIVCCFVHEQVPHKGTRKKKGQFRDLFYVSIHDF